MHSIIGVVHGVAGTPTENLVDGFLVRPMFGGDAWMVEVAGRGISVDAAMDYYLGGDILIQDAFPMLTPEERESLMTGLKPEEQVGRSVNRVSAKMGDSYVEVGEVYKTQDIDVTVGGEVHYGQIQVFGSKELAEFIVSAINDGCSVGRSMPHTETEDE